jgi:hypothetical protein
MSYLLTIRIGRVVCRDPESLSEYDNFGLSGSVIVDGAVTPFAMETVAVNERIAATYANPVIFDGFADSRDIGLVLRGYDVDNNDWWMRHREEIAETSSDAAEVVEYVPVIGEYAAKILEKWPKVVDFFVDLDEDDVLLNHAQGVTLPEASPFLTGKSHYAITIRFMRSDPTGYSDWDYSLPIHFEYQNVATPSLGHTAAETVRPLAGSQPSDWLGPWVAGKVSCHIAESAEVPNGFDVSVTEHADGRDSVVESKGVGISRVYLEQIVNPVHEGIEFTRIAIESATGDRTSVVEHVPIDAATIALMASHAGIGLPPAPSSGIGHLQTVVSGAADTPVEEAIGGLHPGLSQQVEGVANPTLDITGPPPQRTQSGADLLRLNNDAVLEIYQVLLDGQPSGGRHLRYVRPVSPSAGRAPTFDEMLRPRVV